MLWFNMTNLVEVFKLNSDGSLIQEEVQIGGIIMSSAILPLVKPGDRQLLDQETQDVLKAVESRGKHAKLNQFWTDEGVVAYITPCPVY